MSSEFKRILSEVEILTENFNLQGLKIIDVGCGTGKVARMLASFGVSIYGIDIPELINKTGTQEMENVYFSVGTAENIPYENNFADIVLYFASFHHVSRNEMYNALLECRRVVKPGGYACFIEPVPLKNSYYELTRLVEDEAEIQKTAYELIKSVDNKLFKQVTEKSYYLERTFSDYTNLINTYVTGESRKNEIINTAFELITCRQENPDTVVFRSFCRLNILQKI